MEQLRPEMDSNMVELEDLRKIMVECWNNSSEDRPSLEDIQQRLMSIEIDEKETVDAE